MRYRILREITVLILAVLVGIGAGFSTPGAWGQSLTEKEASVTKIADEQPTGEREKKGSATDKKVSTGTGAAVRPSDSGVFTLGEIEVKDSREVNRFVTSDRVSNQDMRLFNADRLPDALDLMPGVTFSNSGNRNEKRIFVRGFGTTQVPVFMDGVPVYMAYDRSFDFNRYTTFDLSEIIVTKGFTSVLYGPNTMGGAINMVTRRPVKLFEGDAGAGYGTGNAWNMYGNVGSKHDKWYFQGGASTMNQTFFPVSGDFTSTLNQHGSWRAKSDSQDTRINVKLGFTPADGHEYVLGWIKHEGSKGQPPDSRWSTSANVIASNYYNVSSNYWLWPRWDQDTYYLSTNTSLGEKSYVKSRWYYAKFENWLDFYTSTSYAQYNYNQGGRSYYDDYTLGTTIETGTKLIPYNDVKAALHYKRDSHTERNFYFNAANSGSTYWVTPPWQPGDDVTLSVGLQDTIDFTKNLYAIAGISYDKLDPLRFKKWVNTKNAAGTTGYVGWQNFETDSYQKFNPQLGLFYRTSETGIIHATAEQKTRFATMKERYSWSFGRSIDNPDLKPESSINYELGYEDLFFKKNLRLKTALFRNDISDAIQQCTVMNPYYGQAGWTNVTVNQNQNIGRVRQYGWEIQGDVTFNRNWSGGLNYTWINRETVRSATTYYARPTDVPNHKIFAHMKYDTPYVKGLSFLGSFEYYSSITNNNNGATESGVVATANAKVMYEVMKNFIVEGGVRNLLDRDYQTQAGYPEPGRTLFTQVRYKF